MNPKQPDRREVPEDLDHNREQKGATHPPRSVGTEIDEVGDDNANHLAHQENKESERRGIER